MKKKPYKNIWFGNVSLTLKCLILYEQTQSQNNNANNSFLNLKHNTTHKLFKYMIYTDVISLLYYNMIHNRIDNGHNRKKNFKKNNAYRRLHNRCSKACSLVKKNYEL